MPKPKAKVVATVTSTLGSSGMINPNPTDNVHHRRCVQLVVGLTAACMIAMAAHTAAQQSTAHPSPVQQASVGILRGTVCDSLGKPVSGAQIRLEASGAKSAVEALTNAFGSFSFSTLRLGTYTLSAEKSGMRASTTQVTLANGAPQSVRLTLESAGGGAASSVPGNQAMEFSDTPNFTVAGVTDWTAVGGHGSDATLRTSEDLARATVALKGQDGAKDTGRAGVDELPGEVLSEPALRDAVKVAPQSYAANHNLGEFYLRAGRYQAAIPLLEAALRINHEQAGDEYTMGLACQGVGDLAQARLHVEAALAQKDTADWHRVAAELDEKLGDPLAAVRHDERAAQLDPSEENYFAWGSELLLHRAVWQAAEVFKSGNRAHPGSARLLTGWGTALFAGALYSEAAERLCEASDLAPEQAAPYLFMGRIQLAAPASLPCIEQKLARFAQAQPTNAMAHYLYAMAIYKCGIKADQQRVESLLIRAVTLDATLGEGYLQLGIMAFAERDYPKAIDFYRKAIEADSKLGEAHYRLGVAYDRAGQAAEARREFQLHDELERNQADALEQQRREIKQFQVVLQGQPSDSKNP